MFPCRASLVAFLLFAAPALAGDIAVREGFSSAIRLDDARIMLKSQEDGLLSSGSIDAGTITLPTIAPGQKGDRHRPYQQVVQSDKGVEKLTIFAGAGNKITNISMMDSWDKIEVEIPKNSQIELTWNDQIGAWIYAP